MSKKSMALSLSVFLLCVGIGAYTQEESSKRKASETFIAKIDSSCMRKTLKVSPDNRRLAYAARSGNKLFVVVDGKEEKQYDGIVAGRGAREEIVFDTPTGLHYLAMKDDSVYLVEENIE